MRACVSEGFVVAHGTFPHFVMEWVARWLAGRIQSSLTKCNYYDQAESGRADGRRTNGFGGGRVTMGIWEQIEIQKLPECNLLKWVFNILCRRRAKNMEFYSENSIKFPIYRKSYPAPAAKWLLERFNGCSRAVEQLDMPQPPFFISASRV